MQNPEFTQNPETVESEYYLKAKTELEKIYTAEENGAIRIEKIIERLSPLLNDNLFHEQSDIDTQAIISALGECKEATTVEEFVEGTLQALDPYLKYQEQHPAELEAHRLRVLRQEKGYAEINEMMYFNMTHDEIQIHIDDVKELGLAEKMRLLKDGMKKLALIIQSNPQLKGVFAASWIVAKNPGLVERLGFNVTGPLEFTPVEGEVLDERPIAGAYITREEILERYSKE